MTLAIATETVPFPAPPHTELGRPSLRQLGYRLRVFDLILQRLLGAAEGRRFVDLGGGPLLFARRAQEAGFAVTAVDARPPWTGARPEGIAQVRADIRGFDVDGFDVVGIIGLLYHLRLTEQIDLLRRCAGRPAVIDTEIWCAGLVRELGVESPQVRPAEQLGCSGAVFDETGNVWSSVGNETSFWLDEPSLLRLVEGFGWRRVTLLDPPYFSRFGRRRWYVLQ